MAKGVKEYSGTMLDELAVREIVGRVSDDEGCGRDIPQARLYLTSSDPHQQHDSGHCNV